MPAIAAWPIVRPVSGAHKKSSVSAFSKLSSMLSRLRCARWSLGSNTVSSVILPESVSDACGTREINETSPPRTRLARREREARLLLQDVEDRLQRRDRAVVDRAVAFFDPSDRRAERDAELAHLAFALQRDERLPQLVVDDRLDPRIVQLQEIDAVGAEAASATRRLARAPSRGASRAAVRTGRGTCAPLRCRSRPWS